MYVFIPYILSLFKAIKMHQYFTLKVVSESKLNLAGTWRYFRILVLIKVTRKNEKRKLRKTEMFMKN